MKLSVAESAKEKSLQLVLRGTILILHELSVWFLMAVLRPFPDVRYLCPCDADKCARRIIIIKCFDKRNLSFV